MEFVSSVLTAGEGRGEMYFDLHHDVNTDKLISSIRKNRKHIKKIGLTTGGKLFVKTDLGGSALRKLYGSLKAQVTHVNNGARTSNEVVSA